MVKSNPSRFRSQNSEISTHMDLDPVILIVQPGCGRGTFSPGCHWVPFCRRMMFPGRTHSPIYCHQRRVTCCELPPPTFTPRRLPAESGEPALKPPARFVAVRMPSVTIGLWTTRDGRESAAKNEVVSRLIMVVE